MSFSRPTFSIRQRRFGRGPARALAVTAPDQHPLSDDLKLFLATFAAGFLFVSILIG